MKLPTPSTSHIPSPAFEELGVYEPSEDSYLFLDTLSSDTERLWLRERFNHPLCISNSSKSSRPPPNSSYERTGPSPTPLVLEVGTGSGIIIAFFTAHSEYILGRRDVFCIAGDVNLNAVREARTTVEAAVRGQRHKQHEAEAKLDLSASRDVHVGEDGNGAVAERESASGTGMFLDTILSNLTSSLRPGTVDLLIFNPPYVPTETLPPTIIPQQSSKFERESQLLALTYAGGHDGMEITNKLLEQLDDVLSDRGVAYVLFCARNEPGKVMQRLRGEGWMVDMVGQSGGKGGWERLSILRIWRKVRSERGVGVSLETCY